MKFNCPHCDANLQSNKAAGSVVRCGNCKKVFAIGDTEEASHVQPAVALPVRSPTTKTCPFCEEEVKAQAKKCKHCGETIDVALRAAEEAKAHAKDRGNINVVQTTQVVGHHVLAGDDFPHLIHLVITVLTCGCWLSVWILHYCVWCYFSGAPDRQQKAILITAAIVGVLVFFCFGYGTIRVLLNPNQQ